MLELPHETKKRLRIDAFLMAAIFIISFLMCCYSDASEVSSKVSRETITVDHVDKAIVHIFLKGFPRHKIYPYLYHPLIKKPSLRRQIADVIHRAATEKNVDPLLLLVTGFREGSLDPESEDGDIGEESMFQMMPKTAKAAHRLEPRCTLDTVEGSAFCCATWLSHWNKKCKSWRGSMAIYATGKTCSYVYSSRVRWLTWDRLTIADKLKKIVLKND